MDITLMRRIFFTMRKRYIIDSSVLLYSPSAIYAFDDNVVFLPACVIKELGMRTHTNGELRANAMDAVKLLDSICEVPGEPTHLKNGGILEIIGSPDTSIFDLATEKQAIIVSRDPSVRLTARAMSLGAEPFKAELVSNDKKPYEGRCNLYVSGREVSFFAQNKILKLDPLKNYYATNTDNAIISEDYKLSPNEYVTLINNEQPDTGSMLGRFDGEQIVPLRFYNKEHPVFGVTARNVGQMFALDALMNPDAPLVILQGPAGTAKTFLSMAAALEQTISKNTYRKILITRPNAKMDTDVGYLKGDERAKVLPTLRGLLDNVENLIPQYPNNRRKDGMSCGSAIDNFLNDGTIDPQAMAYMRGRSICRQFMVVDEMQNSTINQVLSIITRVGEESKIVLLGDPNQIDNAYLDRNSNGLVYAAERMKDSHLCWQITFHERESTRSPLAREAIERLTPKGSVLF